MSVTPLVFFHSYVNVHLEYVENYIKSISRVEPKFINNILFYIKQILNKLISQWTDRSDVFIITKLTRILNITQVQ